MLNYLLSLTEKEMKTDYAFDLKAYLNRNRQAIDRALESCIHSNLKGPAGKLVDSMRYSLFAGGKRLRPILCIAGAEAVGGSEKDVLPAACALEFIHTYSLIHDDLPAMDDDSLRRGKPTNHKVYGEALAVLAGDALLTEAFNLLAEQQMADKSGPMIVLEVIRIIAHAAGFNGMVGGQAADIRFEGKNVELSVVEYIHSHKTAALINASLKSGAMLAGGSKSQIDAITKYGIKAGLAFQISDDILDIEGETSKIGKPVGSDLEKGKATYPSVVGLDAAKEMQTLLIKEAIEALKGFGERAIPLREIARYIIERKK
jgi:geranylgeranyl diphosphate synthase type II